MLFWQSVWHEERGSADPERDKRNTEVPQLCESEKKIYIKIQCETVAACLVYAHTHTYHIVISIPEE